MSKWHRVYTWFPAKHSLQLRRVSRETNKALTCSFLFETNLSATPHNHLYTLSWLQQQSIPYLRVTTSQVMIPERRCACYGMGGVSHPGPLLCVGDVVLQNVITLPDTVNGVVKLEESALQVRMWQVDAKQSTSYLNQTATRPNSTARALDVWCVWMCLEFRFSCDSTTDWWAFQLSHPSKIIHACLLRCSQNRSTNQAWKSYNQTILTNPWQNTYFKYASEHLNGIKHISEHLETSCYIRCKIRWSMDAWNCIGLWYKNRLQRHEFWVSDIPSSGTKSLRLFEGLQQV